MGRIEKTIFLSYRRTNFYTALAVYQDLTAHGYDVFFDYQSIDSGNFATAILENIEARAHFVLVLSSSALERCSEPNDWLRREIETAMDLKRNIVPLMMEGFDFGSPSTVQALSGKLAALNTYNGLRLYSEYFFDAMEKLRTRFLNVALEDVHSREVSVETKETNEVRKTLADEAPQVDVEQITAEEWFERAYTLQKAKNYDEAFRCYTESIRLAPTLVKAHNNLGNTLKALKHYDEAEAAYRKAIKIYEVSPSGDNLDFATVYYNLGNTLNDLKRYDEAEAAYRKAIEIKPNEAITYYNLGNTLKDLKRYDEAEAAYRKAIEINPDLGNPYYNLGCLLDDLKRYDEAEAAYRKAIEINPDYVRAYYNLVILLRITNKTEETIPLLKKIIEITPQDFNSYLALASIDKQAGRQVTKELTEKVRTFMPENDWYNRACLESVCDNFDLAFENLAKASKLERFNPSWTWADPDLQWIIRDDPRFVEIVGPKPE